MLQQQQGARIGFNSQRLCKAAAIHFFKRVLNNRFGDQMSPNRSFSIEEVARVFGVPVDKVRACPPLLPASLSDEEIKELRIAWDRLAARADPQPDGEEINECPIELVNDGQWVGRCEFKPTNGVCYKHGNILEEWASFKRTGHTTWETKRISPQPDCVVPACEPPPNPLN